MVFAVVLSGIFLATLGIFCLKKFWFYGPLTALIYTILSIELLADVNGLTLGVLAVLTIASLPLINIKTYDVIGCLVIALPCIFWLSTQEFVDGSAYSLIIVALGIAIASNLLFDKQKRQTLCALVLLISYIVCYTSNVYFNAVDIATSFLIAIIFTENYKSVEISRLRSK